MVAGRGESELILGVDIGTTFTAAAALHDGVVETIALGANGANVMPSTLFVRENGDVLVGDAANARRAEAPDRFAAEVKRRLLGGVPLVLGGRPYAPEWLLGQLLGAVIRLSEERLQRRVDRLVLTHPAVYSGYGKDLVRRVADTQQLPADLLPEPVAAAWEYVARQPVPVGSLLAIYDLGGGTFDTAVVRRTPGGFDVVGEVVGVERLGGLDFDDEVMGLVERRLDRRIDSLGGDGDVDARRAVMNLQQQARLAKELLARDVDAAVAVGIPGLASSVTVTRAELDAAIRPSILQSIGKVDEALRSSGHGFADVEAIVLVGGSSRLLSVRRLLEERTGRPVVAGLDPDVAIARGAALSALPRVTAEPPNSPPPPPSPPVAPTPPTPPIAPLPVRDRRLSRRVLLGGAGGLVVAGGVAALLASRDSDDASSGNTTGATEATTNATEPSGSTVEPTTAPSAAPTVPPTTEPVAAPPNLPGFTSIRGDVAGQLFVQVGDAGRVVDLGGDVIDAEISPDGSQVAAILRINGSPRLFIGAFGDGSLPVQVFDGDAADPTWRPDGALVAFAGSSGSSTDVLAYDIGSGSVSPIVANAGTDQHPAFSPDGTQLSFTSDRAAGIKQVFVIELATGIVRPAAGQQLAAQRSTWLGDSTAIVAECAFDGVADLALVPLDGSAVRRLTSTPAAERAPRRVDGADSVLVTLSDPAGSFVATVSIDDGTLVPVTSAGTRDSLARPLTAVQAASLAG